jgi:hypothetical protein
LLWNLPEEKLKEMLPPNQMPRIQNGKGVLMLFLCSTDRYSIGKKNYGPLGVAHLIIPFKEKGFPCPIWRYKITIRRSRG